MFDSFVTLFYSYSSISARERYIYIYILFIIMDFVYAEIFTETDNDL